MRLVPGRDLLPGAPRTSPPPARRASTRSGGCRRSPPHSAWCWSRPCRGRDCAPASTSGGKPSRRATRSMISSIASMPCGPPAAERRVATSRSFSHAPGECTAGQIIAVVEVKQRAIENRLGEIQRPARRRTPRGRTSAASTRPSWSCPTENFPWKGWRLPVSDRSRSRSSCIAHRPPAGLHRRERHQRREGIALRFLAAEAAAHARRLRDDLVARNVQHLADHRLDLPMDAGVEEHGTLDAAILAPARPTRRESPR